ncbi:MAG: hypothetical protein VCB43_06585 [Myxococcota bacterium]
MELFDRLKWATCAPQAEEALFAPFLASDESNFFVGQVIPFSRVGEVMSEPAESEADK